MAGRHHKLLRTAPPLSHTSPPRNQHAISASSASFASPPADYGYQRTSLPACQLSHSNHSPSITRPPTLHYRSLHTDHPQSPHQVHHQVHHQVYGVPVRALLSPPLFPFTFQAHLPIPSDCSANLYRGPRAPARCTLSAGNWVSYPPVPKFLGCQFPTRKISWAFCSGGFIFFFHPDQPFFSSSSSRILLQ